MKLNPMMRNGGNLFWQGNTGSPVLTVWHGGTDCQSGEVAEEIALRCNVHDDLVASLSTLLTMLNRDKDGGYFLCEEAAGYVDEARDVLARLEG